MAMTQVLDRPPVELVDAKPSVEAPRDLTARQQVRQWLRRQLATRVVDDGSVELPTLTDDAVDYFDKQPKVRQVFLKEMLRPMVYAEAQRIAHETRQHDPDHYVAVAGDKVVSKQMLERKAAVWSKKWGGFLENIGGKQVPILRATKEELLRAAQIRREQAKPHVVYADLWESLAKDLKAGQVVKDRFSALELERRYQVLEQEYAAATRP